jgi:hypothetical protein
MANTYSWTREAKEESNSYSQPYPLVHKTLDTSPLNLPKFPSAKDRDYVPGDNLTATQSSIDESSYQTSFSRSSYDPLENLEDYLKMRDQL